MASQVLTVLLSEWANIFLKFILVFIFLFILFLPIYFYLILPVKSANNAQKGKLLGVLQKCEADSEGLTYKSPTIESRQSWEIFHKIIDSPNYLLLVPKANKNMFQIIPKRAFVSKKDLQAFTELLGSNIKPEDETLQNLKPKTYEKTWLLIGVILIVGGSCFCLLLYNLSK